MPSDEQHNPFQSMDAQICTLCAAKKPEDSAETAFAVLANSYLGLVPQLEEVVCGNSKWATSLEPLWKKEHSAQFDPYKSVVTSIRGLVAAARVATVLRLGESVCKDVVTDALRVWDPGQKVLPNPESFESDSLCAYLNKNRATPGVGPLRWCLARFLPDRRDEFAKIRNEVSQPVVFVRINTEEALPALLKLTVLDRGGGDVFPDPFTMGLFPMEDDFQKAFGTAKCAACKYLKSKKLDGRAKKVDVCWELVGQELTFASGTSGRDKTTTTKMIIPGTLLEGPSLGLAVAVGLHSAWTQQSLSRDTVISASVDEEGNAVGVGKIPTKVYEMLRAEPRERDNSNWPINQFILAEEDKDAATNAAKELYTDVGLAIRPVKDVSQAIDEASKVRGLVQQYLKRVKDVNSKLPEFFPSRLRETDTNAFAAQRQRVAVVQYVSNWKQAEELSRDPLRSEANVPPERERTINTWDADFAEKHTRAVILGDPGFGKTWLLMHEACRLADQALKKMGGGDPVAELTVPLFARLTAVASRIKNSMGVFPPTDVNTIPNVLATLVAEGSFGETLTPDDNPSNRAIFREWLVEHVGRGKCVLLLDGWDEVGDPKKLGVVTSSLKAFTNASETDAGNTRYGANRLLLASRIVGYGEDPLEIREKDRMELLACEPGQRNDFIDAWFKELKPERGGPERGGELKTALENNPAAAGLAKIPVMLTFLCLLWEDEPGLGLPTRRVEIYERVFKRLAMRWEQRTVNKTETVDVDTLHTDTLDPLCFALFLKRHTDFTRKTATGLLGFTTSDSDSRYTRLKANLALLTDIGLLTLAGKDKNLHDLFTFTHNSFVDYFAACYLAGIVNKTGLDRPQVEIATNPDSTCKVPAALFVDRCAWDPRWQEVLVMLAGELPPRDFARYLRVLKDARTQTHKTYANKACPASDDMFHHRLALAALACGETIPNDDQTEALKLDITQQCLRAWAEAHQWCDDSAAVVPHLANVWGALAQSNHLAKAELVRWIRTKIAATNQGVSISDHVISLAQSAGCDVARESKLVSVLLTELHDTYHYVNAPRAASALCRIDCGRKSDVIAFMIKELGTQDDSGPLPNYIFIKGRAERILCRVFPGRRRAYYNASRASEFASRREAAAEVLGELGYAEDADGVVGPLIERLRTDQWTRVRAAAAFALGKLGCTEDRVITALVCALRDMNSRVRLPAAAARALGNLGCNNERVIDSLRVAMNHEHFFVHSFATEAMVELDCVEPEMIEAQLERLRDGETAEHRRAAAEVLRELGCAKDCVIDVLSQRLHTDSASEVRDAIAYALGGLGRKDDDERVVTPLLKSVLTDVECVQATAAFALGNLRCAQNEVIDVLLRRLSPGNQRDICRAAVWALGQTGRKDRKILQALLDALNSEGTETEAAEALGNQACMEKPVIKELLRVLFQPARYGSVNHAAATALIRSQQRIRIFKIKDAIDITDIANLADLSGGHGQRHARG